VKTARQRRVFAWKRRRALEFRRLLHKTACYSCRRKLTLDGDVIGGVGFRCMFCLRLFCCRCGKKHFGALDGYSRAKEEARYMLSVLRKWLSVAGETSGH
jgi:hypothetical protein